MYTLNANKRRENFMYAYIKGTLEEKLADSVVIDNNGIGYRIYMAINSIGKLQCLIYEFIFSEKTFDSILGKVIFLSL